MDVAEKNNAAVPDLPNPQCPPEPKTDRAHDQLLRTDGQAASCCDAAAPAAVLMIFLACILVGTVHCWKSSPTTPNTHAGRRLKKMNSKQATTATNARTAVRPVCMLAI